MKSVPQTAARRGVTLAGKARRGLTIAGAALAGVFLALAPAVVVAAALSTSSRIGVNGVGPIVIGSTPAQAAATGVRFTATKPAAGATCFYLRPAMPTGLSFMVENGTIRRSEVVNPQIRTTDNFRVGDPLTQLQAFYGTQASLAPDKYDPKAQTLTIVPKGAAGEKYRMVFKIKGGLVQAIYGGALPQVNYVEGCS